MKRILTLILTGSIMTAGLFSQDLKNIFSDAEKQTTFMLREIENAKHLQAKQDPNLLFPCSLTPDGQLKLIL